MNLNVLSYTVYLVLSIGMTIWVARTLSKNGLPFLVDVFEGNRELAGSVNHLLVVGFYLINLGYITLALKLGYEVTNSTESFEAVAFKVGWVLVVLGAMHFLNLYIFSRMRRHARLRQTPPPIAPDSTTRLRQSA